MRVLEEVSLRHSPLDPAGHYECLGVSSVSSQTTLETAFRRKVKQLHPDVPGTGNKDAFIAVKAAYDLLSDPHRRHAYDHAAMGSLMASQLPRRRSYARPWELLAWTACAAVLVASFAAWSPSAGPAPDSAAAKPSASSTRTEALPLAKAEPVQTAMASVPPALPAPTPAVAPDMLSALMDRGSAMMAAGDISAARMLFQRAASLDDPAAMTAAGGTFDPLVLAALRVQGLRPDPALAAEWYRRAAALGDAEAAQRLKTLAQAGLM